MPTRTPRYDAKSALSQSLASAAEIRRAKWESYVISIAALVIVGAGILGLWVTSTKSIRDNYRHYLIGLAQTASTMIDPQLHQSLRHREQQNGPVYRRAVDPLRRLRLAVPDVHFIYTVVRDGNAVRFVLDAADPATVNHAGISEQAGLWEIYAEAGPAMLRALGNSVEPGVATATDVPTADTWGTFMSGLAPIYDANGNTIGAIGLDVDARVYIARLATARNSALLGLLPAGILIAIMGIAFYRIRLRSLTHARAAIQNAQDAKLAFAVLTDERQRLAAVIEGTDVGTWEWDCAEDVLRINERWATIVGFSVDSLQPMTMKRWQSMIHPDDLPALKRSLDSCSIASSQVSDDEFRIRHAGGHWVWTTARWKAMPRAGEHTLQRIAGILLDISERKGTELSLQESESRFRSLFELSPVGMALSDAETGRFLQVNDALLAPTGYARSELLTLCQLDIAPPSGSTQTQRQLQAPQAAGNSQAPTEIEYVRKDGTTFPALRSGIRMKDASGRDVVWSIVQDISQRKSMEKALADAARTDKLTGLANRALFMERLERTVKRQRQNKGSGFAVLFLDFDRFKLINDTLGHKAGDELLCQVALRLQAALRSVDTLGIDSRDSLVSRFGGDEFLILINGIRSPSDATHCAERILKSLAPGYSIFNSEVHSLASVGIVTSEQCSGSAEELVRNADLAMYEAKRAGRGCVVVFNDAMHTRLTRHVAIESGLRRAIGSTELSLVYQPIVDLQTGSRVSVEALARWEHPTLGAISPIEFIPIAEESGLIVRLGQWVLQEACETLAAWRSTDAANAPATVSVNISRAEIAMGKGLLEQVVSTLERTGLPASSLQLEVTEREVMRNPEAALVLLNELHELGVRLAMDDFGTGTSSLSLLREYPFDTIKIDRSFVKDLTTNRDVLAVIHATIGLIENLGMSSLAEGVEQFEQVAVLQSLGCRFAQGYFFSKPVTAAQAVESAARVEHRQRLAAS